MKIYLIQLVTLQDGSHVSGLMKTFESTIRPMEGDLLDDPGFYVEPYEYIIIKISINYGTDECLECNSYGRICSYRYRYCTKKAW
ncbi:hypothetical protein CN553_07430 [Bacillus cereus]|uniref:Uncharacterized protein n=1 Tax=Bacillus cereus TaxID=1396 RepID=A0A9X6YN53_BACCE|nr:hypothetical protein [Bacillus cereus]PEO00194.1 hypothetical protein CN553_07430 [Bacillus cereus]